MMARVINEHRLRTALVQSFTYLYIANVYHLRSVLFEADHLPSAIPKALGTGIC